jgi:integrase
MVLEFAVRQRWLWENPARHVKAVRNHEPRVRRGFTIEEVRKLLEIADPEWRTLIKLGLYTGQRLGDLARLTWQNVDLEKKTIELTTRKTVKHLEIPIAAPLLNHLQNIKKPSATTEMPVCPEAFKMIQNCHGRAGTLCNRFGGRRRRYDLSFHSLRHTAVTLLKEAGTSQVVAMEFIGHDSPAISMSYIHIGAEALKKAAAALPEI